MPLIVLNELLSSQALMIESWIGYHQTPYRHTPEHMLENHMSPFLGGVCCMCYTRCIAKYLTPKELKKTLIKC